MVRIARSSYLGKNPFGDKSLDKGLKPEQTALLRSLQDHCHTCVRVHCTRILSKELHKRGRDEVKTCETTSNRR